MFIANLELSLAVPLPAHKMSSVLHVEWCSGSLCPYDWGLYCDIIGSTSEKVQAAILIINLELSLAVPFPPHKMSSVIQVEWCPGSLSPYNWGLYCECRTSCVHPLEKAQDAILTFNLELSLAVPLPPQKMSTVFQVEWRPGLLSPYDWGLYCECRMSWVHLRKGSDCNTHF